MSMASSWGVSDMTRGSGCKWTLECCSFLEESVLLTRVITHLPFNTISWSNLTSLHESTPKRTHIFHVGRMSFPLYRLLWFQFLFELLQVYGAHFKLLRSLINSLTINEWTAHEPVCKGPSGIILNQKARFLEVHRQLTVTLIFLNFNCCFVKV